MISPIAIASMKTARERLNKGEPIKGSGRRRTIYHRPSIAKLIALCGSIQALGRMRAALSTGAFHGTITPSEKTEREWEQIFWRRVLTFMLSSSNPSHVYNDVLRWGKPPHIAAAIELAFAAQCKSLPSPTEEMRAKGIVIEGVTS